jgi:hypothetical protein
MSPEPCNMKNIHSQRWKNVESIMKDDFANLPARFLEVTMLFTAFLHLLLFFLFYFDNFI